MFDYAIFEELCKKNSVSVSEVINKTGIESATLYSWKAKCEGRTKDDGSPIGYIPKADKIFLLAKFFNCSVEDFVKSKDE